jgi:glycosyltransferase involved in cell wall biosynthesis
LEATIGGTGRHVVDLLRAIDVSRFTVMLIYGSRRADLSFKASLPTLSARGIGLLPLDFGRGVDPVADAVAFARIVRVVKRVKPDVLHLHGAKAGALGRIAAVLCKVRTTVYTPHGGAFHKFTGFGGAIYLAIERLLDRVCKTHYIGVSQDSVNQIRIALRPQESRVHLVYNGIDATTPASAGAGLVPEPLRNDGFKILFPAVFFEAKGHREFLNALSASKSALAGGIKIYLAGDGPLRAEIEKKIANCNLADRVYVCGFVPNLDPWYQASDLVILPSIHEAFGYVLLEAMRQGTPVLASKVGGIREIIRHNENGFFLVPEDWDDLGGALNHYASKPEFLRAVGARGRAFVQANFSLQSMIAGTMAVYANGAAEKRQQ